MYVNKSMVKGFSQNKNKNKKDSYLYRRVFFQG